MKTIRAIGIAALTQILTCANAHAAFLYVTQVPNTPNYSVFIDAQSTVFDAIQLDITSIGSATFTNLSGGQGRVLGDPLTFRNRILDSEVIDGGKGWIIAGPVTTAAKVSYGLVAPNQKITTSGEPGGKLFLANLYVSGPPPTVPFFNISATLVNESRQLAPMLSFGWPLVPFPPTPIIPEPASVGLAGIAIVGLAPLRRRRA